MTEILTLVGIVGTDGEVYHIDFPDAGGRISIPVDQCQITSCGVVIKPGSHVKILVLPDKPPAINPTLYHHSTISEDNTSYICIGARPDLDIPGVLVDAKTGEIIGAYTLN